MAQIRRATTRDAEAIAKLAGDAAAEEGVASALDLDVERRRIEQVEPAPRQHALPGAGRLDFGRWGRRGARHGRCDSRIVRVQSRRRRRRR